MNEEASLLGLQVNWTKTKIQRTGDSDSVSQLVRVGSSQVDVVNDLMNSHTWEHALATAVVSPRSSGALVLSGLV